MFFLLREVLDLDDLVFGRLLAVHGELPLQAGGRACCFEGLLEVRVGARGCMYC